MNCISYARDAHIKFFLECVDHWWHPLGDLEAAPDVFLGFSHGSAQTGHWNSCLHHYPQRAFTLYAQYTMSTPELLDLGNNPAAVLAPFYLSIKCEMFSCWDVIFYLINFVAKRNTE